MLMSADFSYLMQLFVDIIIFPGQVLLCFMITVVVLVVIGVKRGLKGRVGPYNYPVDKNK